MNDLETQVLERIGENISSPDVFVDTDAGMAPIRDSLNDAIEEITMLTGSVKRQYRIPLKSDQGFYRLDFRQGEVAWITNVWLVGIKRRLSQKDFHWLVKYNPRWLWNTGTPERYCMAGTRNLCIHPKPSGSSDMLEIDAIIVPDRYSSDTDRIMLRDNFQFAAVNYAVGEYYASRGNAKQAIRNHGVYLEKLGLQGMYPPQAERTYQYATRKAGDLTGAQEGLH